MDAEIDQFCGDLSITSLRFNIISSNIVNAETTLAPDGSMAPYKRKFLGNCVDRVCAIVEDSRPPRIVYYPDHPHANEEGYVAYPNINTVEEMAAMIKNQRVYEAVMENAPVDKGFFLTAQADECFEKYPSLRDSHGYRAYLKR